MSLLSRYILVELLKVMLLTCAVLVTVIAFGAAIRPLSQNLLGPWDAVKYIALATVPMLAFALPLAAGFSATVVMHRFVTDNEIQAMSVSGLSYPRIVRPVALLGVALVAAMLVVVNWIEPQFWVVIRSMVTRDASRLFVASLQEGNSFSVDRLQIHADEVAEVAPPAGSVASTRLLLAGVAAVQFDASGKIETEFTAEFATIDIYREHGNTYLKPVLERATIYRELDGALIELPRAAPDAVRIGEPYIVPPKFMTPGQMRHATRDVASYAPVSRQLAELRAVVNEADAWRSIAATLGDGGTVELELKVQPRRFEIRNAKIDQERLVPRVGETITIVEHVDGAAVREVTARAGVLTATREKASEDVTFELVLSEPTVRSLRGDGEVGGRWPSRVGGLRLVGAGEADGAGQRERVHERGAGADDGARLPVVPGADVATAPTSRASILAAADALAARSSDAPGPTRRLVADANNAREEVRREVSKLFLDVQSQLMGRAATAVSSLLLPMLGAVLAIWRRNALPLQIYVLAFVPAIANLLLIASGEELLRGGRIVLGSTATWSGNVLLATIIATAWTKMSKH